MQEMYACIWYDHVYRKWWENRQIQINFNNSILFSSLINLNDVWDLFVEVLKYFYIPELLDNYIMFREGKILTF